MLKRVKHASGQPDITKLKFSAIMDVLDAGLHDSPLEVTLTEPPSDKTLRAEEAKRNWEVAAAKTKAMRDKSRDKIRAAERDLGAAELALEIEQKNRRGSD